METFKLNKDLNEVLRDIDFVTEVKGVKVEGDGERGGGGGCSKSAGFYRNLAAIMRPHPGG